MVTRNHWRILRSAVIWMLWFVLLTALLGIGGAILTVIMVTRDFPHELPPVETRCDKYLDNSDTYQKCRDELDLY